MLSGTQERYAMVNAYGSIKGPWVLWCCGREPWAIAVHAKGYRVKDMTQRFLWYLGYYK